jgi:hypothetical protein
MHRITFYPIGNADCCRIDLDNGKKLLFDYAHTRKAEDEEDLRVDLAKELREDLKAAKRDYFDVVAFTHADDDHIQGSSNFFYLEHAKKYQEGDRIKIRELWVPAAMITEDGIEGEGRILRAEARHRLKKGVGIRVISRPQRLKDWLENEGLTVKDREELITDAGNLIPGFTKDSDSIEVFVHSPFAKSQDGGLVDRNEDALVLHATFSFDLTETRMWIIGDSTHEVLSDIVGITESHGRENRLQWDVYYIPHHCSYLAIGPEKGDDKTKPVEKVKSLMSKGARGGLLISCSDPISSDDENDQPPHRLAANYYKGVANDIVGQFKVTMEHPKPSKPEPLVITIDKFGATLKKILVGGVTTVASRPAPRVGGNHD